MAIDQDIDPSVPPSGPGCVECLASEGWWFHLRRCARCGHVGCCDSSPSQHASHHAAEVGHPVAQSYEPGEDWFWDYEAEEAFDGPVLDRQDACPRTGSATCIEAWPRHQPRPTPTMTRR
jgi:hypothetical protein